MSSSSFYSYFFPSSSETSSSNNYTLSQKEKIEKFKVFTGSDNNRMAISYLEKCNWNIEQSIDNYFAEVVNEAIEERKSGVNVQASSSFSTKTGEAKRCNSSNRQHARKASSASAVYSSWIANEAKCTRDSELCAFFKHYSNKEGSVIDNEGVKRLIEDLGIDYTDGVLLVIAYLCNCKAQGVFTQKEFTVGMNLIRCWSLAELKDNLNYFRKTYLDDEKRCRNVYRYTFNFALDDGQKCLHVDTALQYLHILLRKHFVFFDEFVLFIEEKKKKLLLQVNNARNKSNSNKTNETNAQLATTSHNTQNTIDNISGVAPLYIYRDTWICLYDFSIMHKNKQSIKEFDFNGAWPTLIDEFVSWFLKQNNMQSTK